MTRLTHDEYYLQMLDLVSVRSTCGRRAVGAIIVDQKHRVLSTGYNGVPWGRTHCTDEPCAGRYDVAGNNTRCEAVHAEVNAILQCKNLDLAWKIYVTCSPCFSCVKMLCNTAIRTIVCIERYTDVYGLQLLQAQGITLTVANDLTIG